MELSHMMSIAVVLFHEIQQATGWEKNHAEPKLTASQKVHLLRSASSFVTAAYFSVRLIPQDVRALHLDLFSLPSYFDFLQ
jgi:hypothetical protein